MFLSQFLIPVLLGLQVVSSHTDTNRIEAKDRQATPWYVAHYNALTSKLSEIDYTLPTAGLSPSVLALFGDKAFPIATNKVGDVTIAGAEFGKGRVVVLPRTEYATVTSNKPSMATFLANSITWLAKSPASIVVATHLNNQIGTYTNTKKSIQPKDLNSSIHVYGVNAEQAFSPSDVALIQAFVRNGGGLLIGGQAWSLKLTNPRQYVSEFSGNKILSPMGILIREADTNVRSSPVNPIPGVQSSLLGAIRGISGGVAAPPSNLNTILRSGDYVINDVTASKNDFALVVSAAMNLYKSLDPIRNKDVFSKLTKMLLPLLVNSYPPVLPVPSNINTFPYQFSGNADSVLRTITINGNSKAQPDRFLLSNPSADEWRSTGLYAKAGTVVTITFPIKVVGQLKVQVGSQTDTLYLSNAANRFPEVAFTFPVNCLTVKVGSPFGGLIYINIPRNSNFGQLSITVENAYEAPYFINGVTSEAEWNSRIKNFPAPWGEIEIPGQIILSLPASALKSVSSISTLANIYSGIMASVNKLAGLTTRYRTERLVFDLRNGEDFFHNGYPIVGSASLVSEHVNAAGLQKSGTWNLIRELGRNHAWDSWTVDGATDANCNLWSLYVNQNLFKIPYQNSQVQLSSTAARINAWVAKGKPFASWNSLLALDTFSILVEQFSWDGYIKVIQSYYNQPSDSTPGAKYDTWAKKYSQAVNKNLCPYFSWFGWPLSTATKAACASLPTWEEDPFNSATPKYTKFIAITGNSQRGEIVNLNSITSVCQPPIKDYSEELSGAIGGLGYNNEPIICGGFNETNDIYQSCNAYVNNQWKPYAFGLTNPRARGFVSFNPLRTNGRIITAGGYPLDTGYNFDYLTPTGWRKGPVSLPTSSGFGCMVTINSSTILVIDEQVTFFNIDTNKLTSGPQVLTPRYYASCGRVKDPVTGIVSVIVGGGYSGAFTILKTTEILNLKTNKWSPGPNLPVGLATARMLEHPSGGVMIIGGMSNGEQYQNAIHHLPSVRDNWITLKQKLKVKRNNFVAFYVPDTLTKCTP